MDETAAREWQEQISRTARTTSSTGCPDQLLVLQQSRLHWEDGQGPNPQAARILSPSALAVIVAFSILSLVSIDLLPTLSHTWRSFTVIGSLLMISAVLAHIKR